MLSAMLPEEEDSSYKETRDSAEEAEGTSSVTTEKAKVDGKEVHVKSWSFPKDEK